MMLYQMLPIMMWLVTVEAFAVLAVAVVVTFICLGFVAGIVVGTGTIASLVVHNVRAR